MIPGTYYNTYNWSPRHFAQVAKMATDPARSTGHMKAQEQLTGIQPPFAERSQRVHRLIDRFTPLSYYINSFDDEQTLHPTGPLLPPWSGCRFRSMLR